MDLNRFGLDTMVAGIESFEPSPELDMGVESQNEDQMAEEVYALVEANESLDRLLHTGLTDGLESVSETLKIIQLSDTIHTMNAIADGTESYDSDMSGLESALQYAGIDVAALTGYTAGTEAREGGLAQPFRSAGASIKDSKAYKAVSNSWVGKAAGKVTGAIAKIWEWIKNFVFGKKAKATEVTISKVLMNQKKKYAEVLAKSIKEKDEEIAALKHSLENVSNKMNEEAENHVQYFQLSKRLEKEKADMTAFIKKLEREVASGNAAKAELKKTKHELEDTKMQKDNVINQYLEEFATLAAQSEATKKTMEKYAIVPVMDKFIATSNPSPNKPTNSENTNTQGKVIGHRFELNKSVSSVLRSMGYVSKEVAHAAALFKQWMNTPGREAFNKANFEGSTRVPATLSEHIEIADLIGFNTGIESEVMNEEIDNITTGLESVDMIEMLASWDTMMAIDAGVECMNIDIFGHPYTGIDMNTQQVIAFTDRHDFGEAGTEAEETKKEEKPSETAKSEDAKKPGFFENMGAKAKKAGKWAKAKGRQFWKWIKSKISILEPIMDRLAMMTSKSFDLSALNESELGTSLATIDSNLEKVAKLLDKEHKESAKSAEDYTKIIAESKKKVSYAKTVAPIRMIGASDLLKKIKKISKLVNKATEDKVENAGEMTSIMSETTKAIANFNMEIRRALNTAKKVAATTKDIPEKSEDK